MSAAEAVALVYEAVWRGGGALSDQLCGAGTSVCGSSEEGCEEIEGNEGGGSVRRQPKGERARERKVGV